MTIWLSVEEAADFLRIGKTRLYALTRNGRIPASRSGKKWTYEREALNEWLRRGRTVENFFTETTAVIEDNTNLRDPQRDAYARAVGGTQASR